jgi:hypothetical protein
MVNFTLLNQELYKTYMVFQICIETDDPLKLYVFIQEPIQQNLPIRK